MSRMTLDICQQMLQVALTILIPLSTRQPPRPTTNNGGNVATSPLPPTILQILLAGLRKIRLGATKDSVLKKAPVIARFFDNDA